MKIFWADIQAVGIVEANGYENLCMSVKNYEKYRRKLSFFAIFVRAIYCTLPGQVGAVALTTALQPSAAIKVLKPLREMKDFDFLWSHYEFPYISLREVKNIIEIESRKERKHRDKY